MKQKLGGAMEHSQDHGEITVRPKSPGIAVGLSMIIPGAGHLYLDRVGPGVALIFTNIAAWLLTIVLLIGGIGAGFFILALIWIGAAKSAYKIATR